MLSLKPLPGRVLVEIREKYQNVATPDQKYDTKTSGILLDFLVDNGIWSIHNVDFEQNFYGDKIGSLVFWEEYKDGATIERDGKKYAFIKIEDLDGCENVESQ